ncbi:hypothetical protein [Polaromonas sp.]|uniref:hypothetical protein n=1 Tax=Polaromonas sp. TaxID=1869339 RepID=UPI0025F0F2F3|nr:hypothetical protein [Polaromonas sp.]
MISALFSLPSLGQEPSSRRPGVTPAPWTISATVGEESIGQGLPVLALDLPDWPSYRSRQASKPRASRSIWAELNATHPGGWRVGALVRAEAWLQASPDTVTLAALEATKTDPDINYSYDLNARGQSWQGRGIRLGTPWLQLDAARRWHWQADAQLLRLQQFRTIDVSGNMVYRGGDVYDVNVQTQRSNPGITGPFLPASGRSGLGSSLSLALQGEPAARWKLQLRADDLLSRLAWSDLTTDTATLNSQVISRAADGSLNYGPLIQGQKTLTRVSGRIGVHWQAKASWAAFESSGRPDALTLRADRKAGLSQYWLGWDGGDTGRNRPHWRLEIEPLRRAASAGVVWGGWHALLASDGKGTGSEFRSWNIGWGTDF